MPSTFYAWMSNVHHFYWVLCFLLGVFTNLCCETLDVRKRQWIISKNKINRSINHSTDQINQLFDKIIDQSIINGDLLMTGGGNWEREERIGGEVQKRCGLLSWVGRNGSITTMHVAACVCVCVCVCVSVCMLAFVYINVRMHARVCVCMYVCVCEFVSTVNRGHTPTLHIQTKDNIANEDGPRFVDTCKRLQIAYSCM